MAELGKAVALLSFYLEEVRDEGLSCFPACLDSRLLACDWHFKEINFLTTLTKHMIRMSVLIFMAHLCHLGESPMGYASSFSGLSGPARPFLKKHIEELLIV